MAERISSENDLSQNQSTVIKDKDISKTTGEESINTVASAVHEKDLTRSEEDDTLGNLDVNNMGKVSKFGRYKKTAKKGGSVSDLNETSLPTGVVEQESSEIMQSVLSVKSMAGQGQLLDDQLEATANIQNRMNSTAPSDTVSNLIATHEEALTPLSTVQSTEPLPEVTDTMLRPSMTPVEVYERGNYMNNMPPPLTEFQSDDTDNETPDSNFGTR
ncbi:hypothetical protein RUM44_010704 [Polyplax serrata]|uniref:Uncharacterized protein n=1 Tax=Polyplax serrata TaxID=468196 RepID=A0ABR1APQ6_POLSC